MVLLTESVGNVPVPQPTLGLHTESVGNVLAPQPTLGLHTESVGYVPAPQPTLGRSRKRHRPTTINRETIDCQSRDNHVNQDTSESIKTQAS